MAGFEIFISYRRSDAAGHARALHRDLSARFDPRRIFFDRESIESGSIFPERLTQGVTESRVVLALIGPDWLQAKDDQGRRRLDQQQDFVRREIALALQQKKTVVPVLFDDTTPPPAEGLPEELKPLTGCDALTLRGKNYEYDAQLAELLRLIGQVPGVTPPRPAQGGASPVPADRYRITALLDKRNQSASVTKTRKAAPGRPRAFVLVGAGEEWPAALLDRLAYELDEHGFPAPVPLRAPCAEDAGAIDAVLRAELARALDCRRLEDVVPCLTEPGQPPVYYVACPPDDASDPEDLVALLKAWERLPVPDEAPVRLLLLIVEARTDIGGFWSRRGRRRRLEKCGARLAEALRRLECPDRLLPPLASPCESDVSPWIDFYVRKLLPGHAEPIRDFTSDVFRTVGSNSIPHLELKRRLTGNDLLWPPQSRSDL